MGFSQHSWGTLWTELLCDVPYLFCWRDRRGRASQWGESKWKLKNNQASMHGNICKMLSCIKARQLELGWAFRRLRKCSQARIWEEGKEILHSKLCFTTAWLDLVSQLGSWQVCKVAKSCYLWEKDLWADCCSAEGLKAVSVRVGHENAL